MLENELYFTPVPVIERMIQPLVKTYGKISSRFKSLPFKEKAVLDPQGGSGNILDYLCQEYKYTPANLFTIEINPDLRHILSAKGYRIIGTDFLEYDEPIGFDLILTNPPFSEGVRHVLRGWDILNDNGYLVGLLNAENLRNPYCQERRDLLKLLASMCGVIYSPNQCLNDLLDQLEKEGVIEWVGAAFKNSERPTDVEVVIVRLHKPEKEKLDFSTIDFQLDPEFVSNGFSTNTLAQKDVIRDIVSRYNATRQALVESYEVQSKLRFYLQGIESPVNESVEYRLPGFTSNATLSEQLLILKSRFWNTVFTKTELGERTTTDFKKEFNSFILSQSAIAFTENNVKEVLLLFLEKLGQMMNNSLEKVFDQATSYHKKNQGEGWVTNKSWRLNKRIIMPDRVNCNEFGTFSISNYSKEFFWDMDKILCWLSSKRYAEITGTLDAIGIFIESVNSKKENYDQKFESTFFQIQIYKKGTVHLDFKDLKLLEDFKRIAAQNKKWIGSEQPVA